jgi:Fe-Mn family superoxide dismutase
MPHALPPLPYAYDALEPHLDRQTMEIHHGKHHQAYVNNLNKALEGAPDFQAITLEGLLRDLGRVPAAVRTAVRNHGGGTWNHTFYWESLGPRGGGEPAGRLAEALRDAFGGFAAFREKFTQVATSHVGSGWAWLLRTRDGRLDVASTPNQDCPISDGHTPLLVVDLWEHAYYLKYQNRRPDFVAAWWNVVNWEAVARRFG